MKAGIFGAGFTGRKTGALFAAEKYQVWGTTRNPEVFPELNAAEITPTIFDGTVVTEQVSQQLADTTHLIISIAPEREESAQKSTHLVDPTLAAMASSPLLEQAPNLQWIGYLSTVGVYGNHDGQWVDETVPPAPSSQRSRQRLRAEAEWTAIGKAENLPVGIFRLSGIYGPGRNALATAARGNSRRMIKPGQVFNRIHVEDIAQALFLAAHQKAAGLFNITDDEPAPPQDVVTFAHALMGTQPPAQIDFETANLTPMARSFYGENKRVSNAKSKQDLGLVYSYPDFRTALTRMWTEGNW